MACIQCGDEAQIGRFCTRCYLRLHPLLDAERLKGMTLRMCPDCGRHMHKGKWMDDVNKTVSELARARAREPVSVRADCREEKGAMQCSLRASKGPAAQSIPLALKLEKSKCRECGLRKEYFEAILQLRCRKEAEGYAVSDIRQSRMLTEVKPAGKGGKGLDFYLKSTDYALNLARRLRKRYPGTVTISRKLHGRDRATSRNLYRTTVLFRQ